VWRKLASWMRDRDGCNPDKDIIDILPGVNWWGPVTGASQPLHFVGDVGGSPMQDGANQTGKVQGTSAAKIIAESSSIEHKSPSIVSPQTWLGEQYSVFLMGLKAFRSKS
jgi:hypothetical protein